MNLGHRILLLILVILSLSTSANFFLEQYHENSLHIESEKILVKTITQSLSDTLIQDVIDGNQLQVTYVLKKLQNHNNPIEFLYITRGSPFNIFAHSFTNGFPRYLLNPEKPQTHNYSVSSGIKLVSKIQRKRGLIYVYASPLLAGLDSVIHIGINQTEIKTTLAKHRLSFLLISALIVILAAFLAYYWSKKVSLPLANFTKQVQRFGSGKDVNLIDVKKDIPEIRLLANAFQKAVDERQQAISLLEEREKNLDTTLNSIGDAVIATDKSGNITRMNPVALELTGWTLNDALGQSIKTVFPIVNESTREVIQNPIDKVISTGETVYLSNHTTLISKDGTEYQIADSAAPIRNEHDEILGMILVFNDVTGLYQLRQKIIDSEKKYQTLAKMSPVGLFYTDKDGGCLYVNEKWIEITGLSFEQAMGEGWMSALHEDDKEAINTQWMQASKFNKPFKMEYRFISVDGNVHWVLGQAIAEVSDEGVVLGYVGTITDITDRKASEEERSKLQQQLHHSQKMDALGKLTGGIAHDYNNMLGVILGYAGLLQEKLNADPDFVRYLDEIIHAGKRGADLTRRLLSFSRPSQSKVEAVDINTILQDEQHMLKTTLTARIKLIYKLDKNLWQVCLNRSELEDVVMNMSINASHAIDGNGDLFIQTSNVHLNEIDSRLVRLDAGEYVLLSFTDTGCGMDETIKNKIFEPFFSTKGDKGTGLGLSQIYGFVEKLKGTINVYSEPGQGSRFMLYFPRCDNAPFDHKVEDADNFKASQGNEKILVVDDEPALLNLTCEILHQQGYEMFRAQSAQQALDILKDEKIDLLLTDVIMPDVSGYELAATVGKIYPHIKIQMASGFNDESHVNLVDEKLSKDLLCKPYDSQLLFERIRTLLDES